MLYACVMNDKHRAAGRSGVGAVMGSKNLKAVAVRGDNMPPAADNAGVKKMVDWLKENKEIYKPFSDYGTGSPMARFEELGNLPIRNFRDSAFPGVAKINAITLKETISVGMDGCFACPVRCKKIVACEEPYLVDRAYGGPEYETIGALGSACGVASSTPWPSDRPTRWTSSKSHRRIGWELVAVSDASFAP